MELLDQTTFKLVGCPVIKVHTSVQNIARKIANTNDNSVGAERPRTWGGTTALGADVGRIDPGRIDSGRIDRKPLLNFIQIAAGFMERWI